MKPIPSKKSRRADPLSTANPRDVEHLPGRKTDVNEVAVTNRAKEPRWPAPMTHWHSPARRARPPRGCLYDIACATRRAGMSRCHADPYGGSIRRTPSAIASLQLKCLTRRLPHSAGRFTDTSGSNHRATKQDNRTEA
jgi:hypothetical protein